MPAEQPVVSCPNCHHQFPINEALSHELVAPFLPRLRQEAFNEVRAGFGDDLQVMRRKNKEQAEELNRKEDQLSQLRKGEAALRRERRELEEKQADLERKTEEMRDEITKQERDKADERARRRVEEDLRRREAEMREHERAKDARHRDELREYEQKLERANRRAEDLERQTRKGSDTEQGYARQDVFLCELEQRFPHDAFSAVRRGQHGADILQLVRLGGTDCGTILWEVKRAATWQPTWIPKLIGDRDKERALIGAIVTETLPNGVEGFAEREGVWITGFGDALNLAGVLREIVVTAWKRDAKAAMRDANAEKVYDYIMGEPFVRRLDSLSRIAAGLLEDLRKDKVHLDQRWKRTEKLVREMLEVREAIPLDLLERIDSDTELPLGLRAELPSADVQPALAAVRDS